MSRLIVVSNRVTPPAGKGEETVGGLAMALAAAEAGQGIAIARRIHVAEALAAGRLVRPFAAQADDGEGYYLVMTPAAQARSSVGRKRRSARHRCASSSVSA